MYYLVILALQCQTWVATTRIKSTWNYIMWTCEMAFIQVKIKIQAPKRIIWEYIMKHTHHKNKIK